MGSRAANFLKRFSQHESIERLIPFRLSFSSIFLDKFQNSNELTHFLLGRFGHNLQCIHHDQTDRYHNISLTNITSTSTKLLSFESRKFHYTHHFSHPFLSFTTRQYSISRKKYEFPKLLQKDLEESFVRGSGPGGQSINQTSSCVVLRHIPSGMIIKCQETRSLHENRKIARRRLEEKLDFQLHGDQSYLGQLHVEQRKEKMTKRKKAKEKLELKKAFKENVNDDKD